MSVTGGRSMVFSCTPIFCYNETDHHDINEIFLKVALNTMTGLHKLFLCKFQVNLSVKNGYLFYFFLCWFLLLMIFGSLHQCRLLLFVYTCIVVWYPIIVGGGGLDPINKCNPATFVCLSQIMTWISKSLCPVLFVFNGFMGEMVVCFVDIDRIVDHQYLNFLFIII